MLYPNAPEAQGKPRVHQDSMEPFGLTLRETVRYIMPRINPGANGFSYGQVGDVRMGGADGYGAWLEENYGVKINLQ